MIRKMSLTAVYHISVFTFLPDMNIGNTARYEFLATKT